MATLPSHFYRCIQSQTERGCGFLQAVEMSVDDLQFDPTFPG